MSPEEYILDFKSKYGEQTTRDGRFIRDLDDRELLTKVLQRYPGERVNIVGVDEYLSPEEKKTLPPQTDLMKKMEEVVGSIFPGRTLGRGIGTAIAGAGQLAQGDWQGFKDITADAPSVPQQAADVISGGLTLASAGLPNPGTALSRIGVGAGLGGGISGTRAIAEGKSTQDVEKAAGFGAAVGGAIPAVGEAIKGFGKLLQGAGDKIQVSVIKPTAADISDGFSLDTMKKYNLGGSLTQSFQKTESLMDELTKQLNSKITADGDAVVDLTKVYQETANDLLKNKARSFGSNQNVEGALSQLKGEVDGVGGVVGLPDAQTVKRAAGHMGAWQFGMRDPDSNAREKVYNVFYTKIKDAIEKASPEGVKEINKQISELIPVLNALIRRIPVAERNNALSLTDIISLSAAAVDPKALGVGLLNIGSKSGWAGNQLSKVGEQVQKGVPEIVERTARTLIPQTTVPRD